MGVTRISRWAGGRGVENEKYQGDTKPGSYWS